MLHSDVISFNDYDSSSHGLIDHVATTAVISFMKSCHFRENLPYLYSFTMLSAILLSFNIALIHVNTVNDIFLILFY